MHHIELPNIFMFKVEFLKYCTYMFLFLTFILALAILQLYELYKYSLKNAKE